MSESIKSQLLIRCLKHLNDQMRLVQEEMDKLQEAANEETKSSAGDKYETTRAQMMNEKEQLAGRLSGLMDQKMAIQNLSLEPKSEVGKGSLVTTSEGNHYFLAAAIGKISLEGKDYQVISPGAPLARLMGGKTVGEPFEWAGSVQVVALLS